MNSKTFFPIGNVNIGGTNPVVIQSMANTDTNDVAASVAQVGRMVAAGAQMVRLTVPSLQEVPAMQAIRDRLRADGIMTPLVADVHFNPKVAEAMASVVEKVRINPGNYVDKRSFRLLWSEWVNVPNRSSGSARNMALRCGWALTTDRFATAS